MGFRTGAFATVWSVEEKSPTMTKANISISKKNKQTDQWETEFSGFVDFIGTMNATKALKLSRKDRIKLGDVDVVIASGKKEGVYFTNYKVFNFETMDEATSSDKKPAKADIEAGPEDDGEPRLPF